MRYYELMIGDDCSHYDCIRLFDCREDNAIGMAQCARLYNPQKHVVLFLVRETEGIYDIKTKYTYLPGIGAIQVASIYEDGAITEKIIASWDKDGNTEEVQDEHRVVVQTTQEIGQRMSKE